jgi:hypothetical protein
MICVLKRSERSNHYADEGRATGKALHPSTTHVHRLSLSRPPGDDPALSNDTQLASQ